LLNANPPPPFPKEPKHGERLFIYVPSISFRANEMGPPIANRITLIKTTKTVEGAARGAARRLERVHNVGHVHNAAPLFRFLARGALE
jgi:hypothetical protein